MIITEVIVDGKNVLSEAVDTTSIVRKTFKNADFSTVKAFGKRIELFVENEKRVPPSFVCKGRCDACVYKDFKYSGRTR